MAEQSPSERKGALMSIEQFLAGYSATALACFIGGLMWPRHRWPSFVSTGLVGIAYLALVAGFSMWAADCWNCYEGGEITRGQGFIVFVVVWFGALAVGIVLATWLGVLLSVIWNSWAGKRLRLRFGRQA